MKATVFSKAVVMMAVVMASVMNFSASATTPADYVKNEEMTGELMTAKTIFRNEDGHCLPAQKAIAAQKPTAGRFPNGHQDKRY